MSVPVELRLPKKVYDKMKLIEDMYKISIEEQLITAIVKYLEEVSSTNVA